MRCWRLALYNQDRTRSAASGPRGLLLAPTDAFNHYVLALALLQFDRAGESLRSIQSALRLEPEIPIITLSSASIYIHRK